MAAIELARPRRTKALPRQFVLAVTAGRIVAFKAWDGGSGDSDGPYLLRVNPGEQASWPRSSVRLVDLPDGARSKGGTLELAGTERFPVSRPNLHGDPDTDELIDLLGGGPVAAREESEREQRYREDQEALRRAIAVRPADLRELAADAVRGRPDIVTGLHVARRSERHTRTDERLGTWHARPLDGLGVRDQWIAAVRTRSDEAAIERLLRGPIRELLSSQQGLGFEIRIEYGQVVVARQDFLKRDEDLDALVAAAEALAAAVRDICVPASGAQPLATALTPPEWLAAVRRRPKEKHALWPIGARLERVVQVADERQMSIEDPNAFRVAFPGLNFPGQAFGVLHGPLPGTALTGRLLCCAERPMVLPDDFRAFLTDPGGAVGCDVAAVVRRRGLAAA